MKQKGFTLVELLVVVAIIAILSIIGLTIFTSAQSNARDARRKSDVDAIAKAIETNRAPGTVAYVDLKKDYFSGSTVPLDNMGNTTKPQYCIATAITGTVPGVPTAWAKDATGGCPTAPTGYAAITDADLTFITSTNAWRVCARLETSDAKDATLQVFCQPSSQ